MSLVTTLREVEKTGAEELKRADASRPIMVDGSLSEIVTRALNTAYSKKNFTTGEPNYGHANENGDPPRGAGGIPNILEPDSPQNKAIKPSLESMQQMQAAQEQQLAEVLEDAIDMSRPRDQYTPTIESPLIIYALPSNEPIPEEMNSDIDSFIDSGAVNVSDFIMVYTDKIDSTKNFDQTVVDSRTKVTEYEKRGATVFADLQSFIAALPELRQRKKSRR